MSSSSGTSGSAGATSDAAATSASASASSTPSVSVSVLLASSSALPTDPDATRAAFPNLHDLATTDGRIEEDEEVDEEKVRQEVERMTKEEEIDPRPLSLEIIRQRCLPKLLLENGSQEQIDRKLLSLTRVQLDGLHLSSIDDCFDLMAHTLTHVFLQRNALTSMSGLSCCRKLQFLVLSDNLIREVSDVAHLPELVFMDLSRNLIEVLDTGSDDEEDACQLPLSLVALNVSGNPFTSDPDYVEHIVTVSPYLKKLDGLEITKSMRRKFGLEVSDNEEDEESAAEDETDIPSGHDDDRAVHVDAQKQPGPMSIPANPRDEDEESMDRRGLQETADAVRLVRSEAHEMLERSQQRTHAYDAAHGVPQAITARDRAEALAAAAAAAKKDEPRAQATTGSSATS